MAPRGVVRPSGSAGLADVDLPGLLKSALKLWAFETEQHRAMSKGKTKAREMVTILGSRTQA